MLAACNCDRVKTFFLSQLAFKLSAKNVHDRCERYMRQIPGLKQMSAHVLRHSFATHLMNRGADLFAIQQFLGHESLSTTSIYTHASTDKMKDTYNACFSRA